MYAILPQRGVISVLGDDRVDFLQGLVTNDVRKLSGGHALYAALLSPQGKFLHDFFLISRGDAILIDCDKAQLPTLLKRLSMYKLRSKVSIEATDMGVAAAWGTSAPEHGFADPRLPELGFRIIGDVATADASEEDYERHRLMLGVPDGARDMIENKSLLMEFGFEDLHGVDFSKGCYVGQEVTARSKHRGQVRRFIYSVRAGEALPPAGTKVTLDGAEVGEIRSSLGETGLALLRVEAVQKAEAFQCGNTRLKASLPEWVTHPPKALAIEG